MKLDCAVQHCAVVLTSKPGSVRRRVAQEQSKLTPRLHEGCAIGHNAPRVVSVCDAVNRSGVSSSSRASVFEVLRDSQILGSDTLKMSGTREKMTMFPQAEEPNSTFQLNA